MKYNYPKKHNHHTKTEFKKGHKVLGGFQKGNKINLNRKLGIITKRKMSEVSKIRQKRLWQDSEYREMMSKSHLIGEPNNQLGRTRLEYSLWRKVILKRDDFTCQKCRAKSNLEVHHLFSWTKYPELRLAINNGLTLCKKCHKII